MLAAPYPGRPRSRPMSSAQQLDQWLTAAAAGDRRAFAQLYAATSGRLFALLLRVLVRRELAEEALQDSYVRIWLKAASFDPQRSGALTWMASVARHRALDLLRARRAEDALTDPIDDVRLHPAWIDARERPSERAEQDQALERLQRCMKHMDPAQRRALELAFFDGYTHEELARIMNVPLGTVKGRIRRGLARLRGIIGIR
jgi:RNA polymerase sigma-70 factor (ECF subfamily)